MSIEQHQVVEPDERTVRVATARRDHPVGRDVRRRPVLAPILLLARLVQGFSTGVEYGGAATFIAEYAPAKRRGFLGSFLEFGTLTRRSSAPRGRRPCSWGLPSYLTQVLGINDTEALFIPIGVTIVIAPVGSLSDRVGRKPVLLTSAIGSFCSATRRSP